MSSNPPSFDAEAPTFSIKRPEETEKEEEKQDDTNICPHCKEDFGSPGGLGSHIRFKHKNVEKTVDDMKPSEKFEKLQEVYKGDILVILLPNNNDRIYDNDLKLWVSASTKKIPKGFTIYKVLSTDKIHQISPNVSRNHKRSFTEVLCIRKEKLE